MIGLFLLTLVCAFIGGTIGYKLKLPAGTLIGAMLGVTILNLIYGQSHFYIEIRVVLQLVSGAMIGSRIGRKDILELKKLILPTIILLVGMVVLNLSFGGLIYRFSNLDVATALFATAPGGVSDMALISEELGANTAYVGVLQLFRILVVFLFMPPLFRKILTKAAEKEGVAVPAATSKKKEKTAEKKPAAKAPFPWKNFILLLIVAAIGGMICRALGIAAGALTGSMIFSAALSIWQGPLKFPQKIKFFLQVCSGAFIGIRVDRACVSTLPELVVPLLIMFVGIFVFVFAIAFLMRKLGKLDLAVCLMASTPGGVQEMALLSEDLGADTPKIAIMQTCRLMCVVMFFPTMLAMITGLFG